MAEIVGTMQWNVERCRDGFLSLGRLPCIGGLGGINMRLGHSSQSE